MTGPTRPAAYIHVARASLAKSVVTQRKAACQAASALGWPEPAIYLDVDSAAHAGRRPALARLTAAISSGQHDALLLGVGTICGTQEDLMRLLSGCTRNGVRVQCVSSQPPMTAGSMT
jgi:DNA invertase Pin-like site-specific DNA recombinase